MKNLIDPKFRPSKRIIYLAIGAVVILTAIFVNKNHIASGVLGEKSLTYDAAGNLNNPCPEDMLQPANPCVVSAIKSTIANDTSDNLNLTKNLSKNFFTSYLSAQDQNGNVATDSATNIISQVTAGAAIGAAPAEKYTLGGLTKFDPAAEDNAGAKADIRSYGNQFISIYQTNVTDFQKIENPNYDQTANYYKSLADTLSKMRVPSPIADVHLAIINGYNQIYVALLNLNNYDSDPLRGLLAAQTYQTAVNTIPTYYFKIANYFKTSGIIFKKDEPGYVWSQ